MSLIGAITHAGKQAEAASFEINAPWAKTLLDELERCGFVVVQKATIEKDPEQHEGYEKRQRPVKRRVDPAIGFTIRASIPEDVLAADADCGTYVYFMKAGKSVKIGHSKNPRDRARSLQTSRHEQIEILYTVSGGRVMEKYFHDKFAKFRLHGEWFRYDSEIAPFISGMSYEESALCTEPIL
jgi:hypothetical protein